MVTGYGLMLLGSLVALGKNASPGVWLLAHRGIQAGSGGRGRRHREARSESC